MKGSETPIFLVRAGAEGWQVWSSPPQSIAWKLEADNLPAEELPASAQFLSLPARQTVCLCFWVASIDEEIVRQSAGLQIELQGLGALAQSDGMLEVDLLIREEERTLVRVIAFPPNYSPPNGCDFGRFIPSPLALPYAGDGVFLWRENHSVVAVLVSGGNPICWETFLETSNCPELRGGLEAFLLELRDFVPFGNARQIHDRTGLFGKEPLAGLPVVPASDSEEPNPAVPVRPFIWLPTNVRIARESSRRRRTMLKALAAVGAVAALGLAVIGGYLFFLRWETARLQAAITSAQIQAEPVIQAARQWELLSPSINTPDFVLEKMLHAVSALPPDGVRLSVFEYTPEAIRIEGDARNVGLATLYFNALQSLPEGGQAQWTMPPPSLQPDNSARFAIDVRINP